VAIFFIVVSFIERNIITFLSIKGEGMKDAVKWLVILAIVVVVACVAVYIFKEVKQGMIMQKKAEAIGQIAQEATGFIKRGLLK